MAKHFDVIVVGVGAMGSAATYHLARRGKKVLALERYSIPNEMGSSHGITRIIRLAYYEHPSYVPLLIRAYELWRELEQQCSQQLLHVTGSVDSGPPGSPTFEGARVSCTIYDLPHEILTSAELKKRFPGYALPTDHHAVYQPEGGFLLPERCIIAHVTLAQSHGADVRACERVLGWEPTGKGVQVVTNRATYEADRLVVAAGAWISQLVTCLAALVEPERQVLAWFQPLRPELFSSKRFPVFNVIVEEGRFYGFPVFDVPGFKVGRYHHLRESVDPDKMLREFNHRDENVLRGFTKRYFPAAAGPTMAMKTCMFTNTADEHFILDFHPKYPQVVIASPCSGHGFKFSSVIGEILADLVENGNTRHDISMHRLDRLTARPN